MVRQQDKRVTWKLTRISNWTGLDEPDQAERGPAKLSAPAMLLETARSIAESLDQPLLSIHRVDISPQAAKADEMPRFYQHYTRTRNRLGDCWTGYDLLVVGMAQVMTLFVLMGEKIYPLSMVTNTGEISHVQEHERANPIGKRSTARPFAAELSEDELTRLMEDVFEQVQALHLELKSRYERAQNPAVAMKSV